MDSQLIIGAIIGFLGSNAGRSLMIFLWKKLGKYVKSTETEIDDNFYNASPDFLDTIVENFDLGVAEEILEKFLKDLEETDADTSELEDEIKEKESEIKKQ